MKCSANPKSGHSVFHYILAGPLESLGVMNSKGLLSEINLDSDVGSDTPPRLCLEYEARLARRRKKFNYAQPGGEKLPIAN